VRVRAGARLAVAGVCPRVARRILLIPILLSAACSRNAAPDPATQPGTQPREQSATKASEATAHEVSYPVSISQAAPPKARADEPWPAPYSYIHEGMFSSAADDPRAALPFDRIELERGPCPVDTLTFFRDGRAEYLGESDAPRTGRFTATIDPNTYGRLCCALESQGFFELKPAYTAPWTDDSETVLRVWRAGATTPFEVSDYGDYGPINLWSMEQVLRAVDADMKWLPAR
jgi:Domain of unknown function (DUF6438)